MSDTITNTTNTNESKVFNVYVSKSTTAGTALFTRGSLNKTDPTPTVVGLYILEETGIYPNLGNIDAQAGKLNFASFDGTTWSLIAANLPQPIVNNYTNNNTYNLDPEQIVPSEALYTDETLAGDIVKRVDKTTGENVNYRETTTWYDESAMDDSKVDGVIFIKKNGKFYERTINGNISVKWFGAKGDGNSDDTTAINNALNLSNKFNRTLFFPEGTYLTTDTLFFHTTQNIVFESIVNTLILRNHSKTGISVKNATYSFDYGVWKNINIISSNEFKNKGIGIEILRTARFGIENLTVTEFSEGLVLDDVMVSNFSNINFDRNLNKGIVLLRNTNANLFTNLKVLGAAIGTTVGISIDGLDSVGLFTNTFIGGHVEYCNIPVETRNRVASVVFENVYFENNLNGCILREKTQYVYFNNCFIANKELISDEEFGATSIYVYGLTDDFPIGVGNTDVNIKIGNNTIKYRNDNHVEDNDYLSSKNFGAHSIFHSHGGNPASQFASNCMNRLWTIDHRFWVGGITEVGKIGKAPYYNITDTRWISFHESGVANQDYTFQLLVKGKGVVRLRASDNISKSSYKDFNINTTFFQPISITFNFGETTSENIALSIDILSQDQNEKIAVSCADFHKGLLLNPFVHRQYTQTENRNFEVIDMLNFRLKSSAVPATITGYIDGDEVINDFSVDDTFFKAVMVNGSWKSVGFI